MSMFNDGMHEARMDRKTRLLEKLEEFKRTEVADEKADILTELIEFIKEVT